MKANSAHRLLPFRTFGEAAAFDLEVEVFCRCGRCVVIDGMAPAFRDRRIMGARFHCTTILPHGVACGGSPSIYIRKRGRGRWTMADHSRAIRARQVAAPIDARSGTFASIVKRCEVAFLYDRGCVPSYTVDMIEFDEPPWIASSTSRGAVSFAQDAVRRSTCTLAMDPVHRGRSVSTKSLRPLAFPQAGSQLHGPPRTPWPFGAAFTAGKQELGRLRGACEQAAVSSRVRVSDEAVFLERKSQIRTTRAWRKLYGRW